MQRTLTAPHAAPATDRANLGAVLAPLLRYVLFVAVAGLMVAVNVLVRLDAQQQRKDLNRTSLAILEAEVLRDRLVLEREARRRSLAMERAATHLGLGPQAQLLSLGAE